MASWITVPCLIALRNEFNVLAPGRDRGADGTIGDSSHTSTSDHTPDEDSNALDGKDADHINEVHALDIDSSGPWPRPFADIIADIVAGERRKWLSSSDMCRLEYVIYNRKIYSKSRDFLPVAYTRSDPHTNHAHFSARYLTETENDTRPWGVLPTVAERIVMEFVDWISALARAVDPDVTDSADDRNKRREFEKVVDYFTDRIAARVDTDTPAE